MDESAQIHTESGTPVANYSIVQGGWSGAGGTGVIDADPLFVNPDLGNFQLSPDSPAIDAADTTSLPADAFDLDGDGDTVERLPLDLVGNLRLYDDPDTADTGVPGSPVVDMGAFEFFTDCNENGLPDECDLDCAALGGECNLPGCGLSDDCDANSSLDKCDIAGCAPGDPACDDCNLNGIPDACDIDPDDPDGNGEVSADVNIDGIPDECTDWDADAGDALWSTPTNWENDVVPGAGDHPTIDGNAIVAVSRGGCTEEVVDLDVPGTADSLRLLNRAVLNVTGSVDEDLTILSDGGVFVQGELSTNCPSSLRVANDRVVDISTGPLKLAGVGRYHAATGFGAVSASLLADSVEISHGSCTCPDQYEGGHMILMDTMSVTTSGDFVLDGSNVYLCDACPPARGGIIIPPKLDAGCGGGSRAGTPQLSIEGSFIITGIATVNLCAGAARADAIVLTLGGDFINQSRAPDLFNAQNAGVLLAGTGSQQFEAGGEDRGTSPTSIAHNFAIGTIEVAENSELTFADLFDNDGRGQATLEAQYVDTLIFRAGTTITIDGVKLYYNELIDEGATIVALRSGQMIEASFVLPPGADPGGSSCVTAGDCAGAYAGADCAGGTCYIPKNRYLSIDPTTNGGPVAYQVELTGTADYPTALGRTWWVDVPVCYDYPNGSPVPGAVTCDGPDRFGWVSGLTAAPVTRVWTEVPVHVGGCGVVPAVDYEIRASADGGASFSTPLAISTSGDPAGEAQSWGDITGGPVPGMPGLWLAPEGATNFGDVGNAIGTFEGRTAGTGSPPRVWVDVEINRVINLGDIQFIINAFEGKSYADIADLPNIGVHPEDCP